jgi:excinuclease ABC subunit A
MSKEDINIIMYGSEDVIEYEIISRSGDRRIKNDLIEGIATKIERRYLTSSSEMVRK